MTRSYASQPLRNPYTPVPKPIRGLLGGMRVDAPADELDERESPDLLNVVTFKNILRVDTGYSKFRQAVRGTPQKTFTFLLTTGSSHTLLITTATVYQDSGTEWQYISNGTSTTTTGTAAAGGTAVTISSTTGLTTPGTNIGIELDNGTQLQTTVASVVGSTLNFVDLVPVGRSIQNGAQVLAAVVLNGSVNTQISVEVFPSLNFMIFTNGIDNVQRYDGQTCVALAGLVAAGVTACRHLQVFYSQLVLFDTTEGGMRYPQRVRRSNTGDPTNWTTGTAGYDDLLDTDDFIKTALPLGPYMIVYRDSSVVRMNYVGLASQNYFFEYAVQDTGVLSLGSVVAAQSAHFLIGLNGIFKYTGTFSVEDVGEKIAPYVLTEDGNLAVNLKDQVFTLYVKERHEIWIFYPSSEASYPDTLLRYNIDKGVWFVRQFANKVLGGSLFEDSSSVIWSAATGTWAQKTQSWSARTFNQAAASVLLCSPDNNQVYNYDYVSTKDDATAVTFKWTSKDFIQDNVQLTIDGVRMRGKGNNVLVEVSADSGVTWQTMGTVNFGQTMLTTQTVDYQYTGYSLRFRLSGNDPSFQIDWIMPRFMENAEW